MTDPVPLSFSDALQRNKRARDAYARLSPADQCRILARAGHIHSADNLNLYVMSLSDEVHAEEYF